MFRKRWARRLAVALPVAFVLVVAGFYYIRHKTGQQGEERVAAVTAGLDAADARWRYDDIDADRGTLPDGRNSALLVPRFKAALARPSIDTARPDRSDLFDKVPPNHQVDDEGARVIDRALDGNDAALAIARSFKDYPRGLRRYRLTPDVFGTLLPEVQEHRTATLMLSLEAERLAYDGRPGAALHLVPAMVNVARGLDGEPFLVSALVRIACDTITARRTERALALGVPKAGLADVQSALLAEAEGDVFWGPLRGERACLDHLFNNLRTGVVPPSLVLALADSPGTPTPVWKAVAMDWTYRPFAAHDHAAMLERFTAMCEVRRLPEHQRRAALKAVPPAPDGPGTRLTRLLLPHVEKLHDSGLRNQAVLRCAGVAVACERFRQARGRWPDSLAELPKDLLPAVLPDPFDGRPLKYARRADGVTVYSVGFDETDNGGNVPDTRPSAGWQKPGLDLGFRLFDPARRGLRPVERPRRDPEGVSPEPGEIDLREPGGPVIPVSPVPREVGGDGW
jgi:hypothetical protein